MDTMDDEILEKIRERKRNVLEIHRRKNRSEEADSRRPVRCLLPKKTHPETILMIANKLKTRSQMRQSELRILKNALIDDENFIKTVLNTNGALRGLVREMTGHNVEKQCAAVGCCCNLALGDVRAGLAVSKAAGPYLVAILNNLSTELTVTSAWTLGNLAGSGPKACDLLISQGAVAKLVEILGCGNEEVKDAALYALVRFAYQLKHNLRTTHLQSMLAILHHFEVYDSSHLLFILSCHKDFTHNLVSNELLTKLLEYLSGTSQAQGNQNVTYIFRFLANCYSRELYEEVLDFFVNSKLVDPMTVLFGNDSFMWFVSNAYKLCSDHIYFKKLLK